MANVLTPLAGLCALILVCVGCSSDDASDDGAAGSSATAPGGAATQQGGAAGTTPVAGAANHAGVSASGNATSGSSAVSGGGAVSAGGAGSSDAGSSGGPPPAVDGHSVYTLECHGDSKDCNRATVPCFGVSSPTPNVAAGWACANRCVTNADCSDAPSGAPAQASCVSFSSAGHCVLVCQDENQTFACPDGMGCYVPPKSPIGYCLWQ